MTKNLLQDMKIKSTRGHLRPDRVLDSTLTESKTLSPSKRLQHRIWLVAAVSILFFIFALSYLFLKATVAVVPQVQNAIFDKNLFASRNGDADVLPFELLVISGEEERAVRTGGEKEVFEKARGVVVVYNAFSSAPQRLDIETRLEGSNGKIYKTERQITVPGMTGEIPGSVAVVVYATEAGQEYNSGPLDFTIVGFRGTPKYSKFYAISNIEDLSTKGEISGGFKGKIPVISDEEKKEVTSEIREVLREKLFEKAASQIPENFVLFDGAVFLETKENDIEFVLADRSTPFIKVRSTLYGFLFDRDKLAQKLAEGEDGYKDGAVYLLDVENLVFSLSKKDHLSFESARSIDFNLKGETRVVWKLDEEKFMSDLIGKSKKEFNQILEEYPGINSADLTISPFWRQSFPDNPAAIKIIVDSPN